MTTTNSGWYTYVGYKNVNVSGDDGDDGGMEIDGILCDNHHDGDCFRFKINKT